MRLAYVFVAATVLCTVYGQLIFKWQTSRAGELPPDLSGRLSYLLQFVTNPWVITSLAAAVIAAASWVGALTQLELSRAYPFVAASFVLVLVSSAIFFGESMTATKIIGALLIVAGLIIGSQS